MSTLTTVGSANGGAGQENDAAGCRIHRWVEEESEMSPRMNFCDGRGLLLLQRRGPVWSAAFEESPPSVSLMFSVCCASLLFPFSDDDTISREVFLKILPPCFVMLELTQLLSYKILRLKESLQCINPGCFTSVSWTLVVMTFTPDNRWLYTLCHGNLWKEQICGLLISVLVQLQPILPFI